MKKLACIILALIICFSFTSCASSSDNNSENSTEASTDWKTVFKESGFSDEEIAGYSEILNTVGITDYHDVEIIENGIMHIVRGKIFDSDNLQVNVTLENRKIIYISLAGIPATETKAYINWRGNIKFKTENTTQSVDLYSDTEGGYLVKYDYEENLLSAI